MLLEEIVDLLLGHVLVKVLDEEVRLLIESFLGVRVGKHNAEGLTEQHGVVHLIQAALGFGLVSELEVAVTSRLGGLGI